MGDPRSFRIYSRQSIDALVWKLYEFILWVKTRGYYPNLSMLQLAELRKLILCLYHETLPNDFGFPKVDLLSSCCFRIETGINPPCIINGIQPKKKDEIKFMGSPFRLCSRKPSISEDFDSIWSNLETSRASNSALCQTFWAGVPFPPFNIAGLSASVAFFAFT
jgi:hypothetical protein